MRDPDNVKASVARRQYRGPEALTSAFASVWPAPLADVARSIEFISSLDPNRLTLFDDLPCPRDSMWLLSTDRAELEYFNSPDEVEGGYAILSHVWQNKELSFQDVQALRSHMPSLLDETPRSRASEKIRRCCMLAEEHGYRWVWIDTCCIDKTSSSELSEAINSMFQWYSDAGICYAYLQDVSSGTIGSESQFYKSRWFTRGWTLQELIAPESLLFISRDWSVLGTRTDFVEHLVEVTLVDADILLHRRELGTISVAQRMSWASRRNTTRSEDEAYCLMGIFGVNMPTIYGEGRAAFYRLQEEIMKVNPDQTLFAWGPHDGLEVIFRRCEFTFQCERSVFCAKPDWRNCCLLASSPKVFGRHSAEIEPISTVDAMMIAKKACLRVASLGLLQSTNKHTSLSYMDRSGGERRTNEFTITSQGMRSILPVIKLVSGAGLKFAIAVLGCRNTRNGAAIGILLYRLDSRQWLRYQGEHEVFASHLTLDSRAHRLVVLSADSPSNNLLPGFNLSITPGAYWRPGQIEHLYEEDITWDVIYILHRPLPHMNNNFDANVGSLMDVSTPEVQFSKWSIQELRRRGFHPAEDMFRNSPENYASITFRSDTRPEEGFTVECRRGRYRPSEGGHEEPSPPLATRVIFPIVLRRDLPDCDTFLRQAEVMAYSIPPNNGQLRDIQTHKNWKSTFGTEDRAVTLTVNMCRFSRLDSTKSGAGGGAAIRALSPDRRYRYIVDISIAGAVYVSLRDQPGSSSGKMPPFVHREEHIRNCIALLRDSIWNLRKQADSAQEIARRQSILRKLTFSQMVRQFPGWAAGEDDIGGPNAMRNVQVPQMRNDDRHMNNAQGSTTGANNVFDQHQLQYNRGLALLFDTSVPQSMQPSSSGTPSSARLTTESTSSRSFTSPVQLSNAPILNEAAGPPIIHRTTAFSPSTRPDAQVALPASLFNRAFRTWCARRGIYPDERLMTIDGKRLDLYVLHQEVLSICSPRDLHMRKPSVVWAEIGCRLGFVEFAASHSFREMKIVMRLYDIYNRYLEQFHDIYIAAIISRKEARYGFSDWALNWTSMLASLRECQNHEPERLHFMEAFEKLYAVAVVLDRKINSYRMKSVRLWSTVKAEKIIDMTQLQRDLLSNIDDPIYILHIKQMKAYLLTLEFVDVFIRLCVNHNRGREKQEQQRCLSQQQLSPPVQPVLFPTTSIPPNTSAVVAPAPAPTSVSESSRARSTTEIEDKRCRQDTDKAPILLSSSESLWPKKLEIDLDDTTSNGLSKQQGIMSIDTKEDANMIFQHIHGWIKMALQGQDVSPNGLERILQSHGYWPDTDISIRSLDENGGTRKPLLMSDGLKALDFLIFGSALRWITPYVQSQEVSESDSSPEFRTRTPEESDYDTSSSEPNQTL